MSGDLSCNAFTFVFAFRTARKLDDLSNAEELWDAVGGLLTHWILTDIPEEEEAASEALQTHKQYRVTADGSPSHHGWLWASEQSLNSIHERCRQEARKRRSCVRRFAPQWRKQTIFVAVPAGRESDRQEWRLDAQVVSIGQLLYALCDSFTAAEVHRFWLSLVTAAEKRGRKRSHPE